MEWAWFLLGAVLFAPLWFVVFWYARRNRRRASRQDTRTNESFAELSQIVGGLAHEIKNPLSTINLNLKLLGEDLARYGDEEHRRLVRRLERVQHEADRLHQTLEDFLHYAGHYELTVTRVDLRDIVAELREFFAPQAEATGVILRTAAPHQPVPSRVDVKLFKQVLLNLMINGAQAMESGGELLVKVSMQGEKAQVEVIDTGEGIEQDKLETVFEPYWTSKQNGSGLGLSTARRIMREHGGSITVESEVGKGTRFLLSLPVGK